MISCVNNNILYRCEGDARHKFFKVNNTLSLWKKSTYSTKYSKSFYKTNVLGHWLLSFYKTNVLGHWLLSFYKTNVLGHWLLSFYKTKVLGHWLLNFWTTHVCQVLTGPFLSFPHRLVWLGPLQPPPTPSCPTWPRRCPALTRGVPSRCH